MKIKTMKQIALVAVASLALASVAKADTLRIACSPTCPEISGIQQVANATPTLNFFLTTGSTTGSPLFVVFAIPGTNNFSTFKFAGIAFEEKKAFNPPISGPPTLLGNVLTEPGMTNDYNTSAFLSFTNLVLPSGKGYTVYEFNLGNVNLSTVACCGGTPSISLPVGTVVVAWLEDGHGNVVNQVPYTGAVLETVPEPGTLALFGSGLLGIAALIRRRLSS